MRCDSHVHIVGEVARYPQAPNRLYTADVAQLTQLQRLGARRDITRFVLVQPSFYQADNTLLLESLAILRRRGRGVAVIDPGRASPASLAELDSRGVCGLRINHYSPPGGIAPPPLERVFAPLAAVARAQAWHVEVIAPLPALLAASGDLARAAVPVVIDHYGLPHGTTPDSAAGQALLALMARPHVWTKLSAPYRATADPLATRPDPAWLAAILERAAERCVWGSDWPHTPRPELQTGDAIALAYRALRYDDVVDDFLRALPANLAERIMIRNPAARYGFVDGA
jgi:2-pyrone-4,6-dicarboxylate lactonase